MVSCTVLSNHISVSGRYLFLGGIAYTVSAAIFKILYIEKQEARHKHHMTTAFASSTDRYHTKPCYNMHNVCCFFIMTVHAVFCHSDAKKPKPNKQQQHTPKETAHTKRARRAENDAAAKLEVWYKNHIIRRCSKVRGNIYIYIYIYIYMCSFGLMYSPAAKLKVA